MTKGALSLEKKVGQLFMVGLPGTSLKKQQGDLLGRLGIGGVVLFSHNYESVTQLTELCNSLQKVFTAETPQPGWIAVDHEGGRVQRFKQQFSVFPALSVLGEINSPKTCFEMGFVMGRELASCGVNVNFAPVIDVLQKETTGAIGDRAFSSNPDIVGSLGSALMRGLMKGGVLAVAKHFPGHGAVKDDSHADLPICNKTVEELEQLDWQPFRKVFRSRVEAVMTAHILYPKIDTERPATLSRKLIQEHLRKSLRYTKLIFSDDLEMGALVKKYSLKDAAFLAIEAGCDQLLFCHEWDQVEDIWRYLVNAFESGALPIKKLDESLERIQAAKKEFLEPFKFSNAELAKYIVGAPDFTAVADAIRKKKTVEDGPSTKDVQAESHKESAKDSKKKPHSSR